jgi:hypothetical protein
MGSVLVDEKLITLVVTCAALLGGFCVAWGALLHSVRGLTREMVEVKEWLYVVVGKQMTALETSHEAHKATCHERHAVRAREATQHGGR